MTDRTHLRTREMLSKPEELKDHRTTFSHADTYYLLYVGITWSDRGVHVNNSNADHHTSFDMQFLFYKTTTNESHNVYTYILNIHQSASCCWTWMPVSCSVLPIYKNIERSLHHLHPGHSLRNRKCRIADVCRRRHMQGNTQYKAQNEIPFPRARVYLCWWPQARVCLGWRNLPKRSEDAFLWIPVSPRVERRVHQLCEKSNGETSLKESSLISFSSVEKSAPSVGLNLQKVLMYRFNVLCGDWNKFMISSITSVAVKRYLTTCQALAIHGFHIAYLPRT